jgi:hypothetical protein
VLFVYFYYSALKSKLSFWFRARWRFLLSVVGFILAGVSFVIFPERLGQALTLISFVISCVSLSAGLLQLKNESKYSLELNPLDDSLISSCRPNGWQILQRSSRAAIYSEAINRLLPALDVTYTFAKSAYRLPEKISPYGQIVLNKRRLGLISNEGKVGQRTDLDHQSIQQRSPIVLYDTDYHNGLLTNDLALLKLMKTKGFSPAEVVVSGRWFFIEEDRTLSKLSDQRSSNHIGVSTIAIFDDIEIPLVVQSQRSLQSTGQIAPSGSGSADRSRNESARSGIFAEFVAGEMERELREELGLSPSIKCQSLVVGYCRMLDRAGKPEYFGLTRVFSPIGVIRRTLFERLFTQRHVRVEDIVRICNFEATTDHYDRLLQKLSAFYKVCTDRQDISIITELNAQFAVDFVKRDRPRVEALISQRQRN